MSKKLCSIAFLSQMLAIGYIFDHSEKILRDQNIIIAQLSQELIQEAPKEPEKSETLPEPPKSPQEEPKLTPEKSEPLPQKTEPTREIQQSTEPHQPPEPATEEHYLLPEAPELTREEPNLATEQPVQTHQSAMQPTAPLTPQEEIDKYRQLLSEKILRDQNIIIAQLSQDLMQEAPKEPEKSETLPEPPKSPPEEPKLTPEKSEPLPQKTEPTREIQQSTEPHQPAEPEHEEHYLSPKVPKLTGEKSNPTPNQPAQTKQDTTQPTTPLTPQEEIDKYIKLLKKKPGNVEYLIELGKLYRKVGNNQAAAEQFEKGLKIQPNNPDLNVLIGFSYLQNNNLEESRKAFSKALEISPKYVDALAGLGRIAALKYQYKAAENYFDQALNIDPENATALELFALLKITQNKYSEAEKIYTKLLSKDPNNVEFQKGLQRAKNFEEVKTYVQQGDYKTAEQKCFSLIKECGLSVENLLALGKVYRARNWKGKELAVYNKAYAIAPQNVDVLNALAYVYLKMALTYNRQNYIFPHFSRFFYRDESDLRASQVFYNESLAQNSKNVDALSGLGRIATIDDYLETAESYLCQALSIDPSDSTALTYLASLELRKRHFFKAEEIYSYLASVDPNDQDSKDALWNRYFLTHPSFSLKGFYSEENEKNAQLDDWIARLKVFGGLFSVNYPINDCLTVNGSFGDECWDLKQLITGINIYSLNIQRALLNSKWNYNRYITVHAGLGMSVYGRHNKAIFHGKHGILLHPNLGLTYNRFHHTIAVETDSDAVLVYRNFKHNTAKFINRQIVRGFYEYDFGKGLLAGAEGANLWLFDPLGNEEHRISGWLQVTPPCFWENLTLRYLVDFKTYRHLTLSYYTFQDQTTNWLQIEFSKNWFKERAFTKFRFSRGWQRGFESGEIIAVTPTTFRWITRRIVTVSGEVGLRVCRGWDLALTGFYYHDNFDYTVGAVSGAVKVSF